MPRVNVRRVNDPGGGPRQRHSDFHITVSTNKRPVPGLVEALGQAVETVFNSDVGLAQIIHFTDRAPNWHRYPLDDPSNTSVIQDIDGEHVEEVGEDARGGRVHSHIILNIKHKSNIQIGKGDVKRLILQTGLLQPFGVNTLYTHIKLLPNVQEAIREYQRKKFRREARDAFLRSQGIEPLPPPPASARYVQFHQTSFNRPEAS